MIAFFFLFYLFALFSSCFSRIFSLHLLFSIFFRHLSPFTVCFHLFFISFSSSSSEFFRKSGKNIWRFQIKSLTLHSYMFHLCAGMAIPANKKRIRMVS